MIADHDHMRTIVLVGVATLALAALAAAITFVWPDPVASLFPHAPKPHFAGMPVEVVNVLVPNIAVLLMPFLFAGAAAGRPGAWRHAGDVAAVFIVAVNSSTVGAALALNGTALLPYLPHLPLEATALVLAVSGWFTRRTDADPAGRDYIAVIALATVAALVEVYATPHVIP